MHMKMKNMKGIDLSCASPSSTAICSSVDQRSIIKNSTKSLHRLNTYLADHYKTLTTTTNNNNPYNYYSSSSSSLTKSAPCISELPFTPRPSSFSIYRDKTRKLSSQVKHSDVVTRGIIRRSSVDYRDIKHYNNSNITKNNNHDKYSYYHDNISSSTSHSSRYLLGDESKTRRRRCTTYCDDGKDDDTPTTPVFGYEGRRSTSSCGVETTRRFGSMLDDEKEKIRKHFSLIDVGGGTGSDEHGRRDKSGIREYDGQSQRQRSMGLSSSQRNNDSLPRKTSSSSPHQVVVLRVSLHCRGCENKLRKHLSKMEGVTSYNIDMETKKVTVVGHVTPSEVLTSISKVKNAQYWPSQASLSSSTSASSTSSSSSSTI